MTFWDLFFPRRCLGCQQTGAYLCADCLIRIAVFKERFCPVCGWSAVGGQTHPRCQKPWGLAGLTNLWAYQGLVKRAIKKMKFKFVVDLADTLVELALTAASEDPVFQHYCQLRPIMVPIPMNPAKL